MKSFVIGYYGFGNAGDERLLNRTVVLLKELYPKSQVCALVSSKFPQQNGSPFSASRLLGEMTYCSRRSLGSLIQAFVRCDQVVFGGGGIFQDTTSFRSMLYYSALVFVGIFLRKKIVLLGQGIGPLKRRSSRWLMKKVGAAATSISVRDEASLVQLLNLGVPQDKIKLTADLAYYRAKLIDTESPNKAPLIGLSLRASEQNLDALAVLLSEIKEDFLFLDFFNEQDQQAIPQSIKDKIVGVVPTPQLFERQEGPSLLDSYRMSYGIVMRYHACVCASLQGTPFLALAYDDKVEALAKACGQEYIKMSLESPQFYKEFSSKWALLQANREAYKQTLLKNVAMLIEAARANKDIFERNR